MSYREGTDRLIAERLRENHLEDLVGLHLDPRRVRYPAASLTEIRLSQLKLPPLIGLVLVEHGVSQRVLEKSNYRLEKRATHHGEDVVI